MIIRRLVLSLVLVLFASVTIGVIVGLDDQARSELVSRLPSTTAVPSEPPAAKKHETPSTTPMAQSTTAATPTPKPTVQGPVAPRTTVSPEPTATAKPTARPKPNPTVKPKPKPAPTTKAAPKKTDKRTDKAKESAKAKKAAAAKKKQQAKLYLKGPLKKGPGGTVYLTFDDGPSPYTAQILAELSRTGSTATFFHLGVNEGAFPHADARIRAQGSKVANHSYNHPDLTYLTPAQLKWQLRHGPKAKCFRPPYGATNAAVRKAIANAGMRQVLWDVDTLDWTKPGVATLAKTGRLKSIRNGSIVLMHDGGGDRSQTVAALHRTITDLHTRGFKIRALPSC